MGLNEYALLVTDKRSILVLEKGSKSGIAGALGGAVGAAIANAAASRKSFDYETENPESFAINPKNVVIPHDSLELIQLKKAFLGPVFRMEVKYQAADNKRKKIKGKPPQTYLRPDRKWIFGQHNDIYYYQFFDPDRDQFGNITVFQLDRATFSITRRIHADRAHWADNLNRWVYEQGWQRSLLGSAIAPEGYRTFDVSTFPELSETPAYFKKEVKQYNEMNYEELRSYIRDLQQSGFDVVRLRVQLHKKLSYPLITLIMAILAIPFSLSTGKKGAITGVAVAVGIAAFYIVVTRFFEAMGDQTLLPSALAVPSAVVTDAEVGETQPVPSALHRSAGTSP